MAVIHLMSLYYVVLCSSLDSASDTVADKKKFPFPLRAMPFRFCSVGVPFPLTFSVALNCVPLRTA